MVEVLVAWRWDGSERNTRVPIEPATARSSVGRAQRVARGGDPHAVGDPFIRFILSRTVPRELLIDILRPPSNHDLTPLVTSAHSAHIRALLRRKRRSGAQAERLWVDALDRETRELALAGAAVLR